MTGATSMTKSCSTYHAAKGSNPATLAKATLNSRLEVAHVEVAIDLRRRSPCNAYAISPHVAQLPLGSMSLGVLLILFVPSSCVSPLGSNILLPLFPYQTSASSCTSFFATLAQALDFAIAIFCLRLYAHLVASITRSIECASSRPFEESHVASCIVALSENIHTSTAFPSHTLLSSHFYFPARESQKAGCADPVLSFALSCMCGSIAVCSGGWRFYTKNVWDSYSPTALCFCSHTFL